MKPEVSYSKLPDAAIFGERKVTEIKLPDGALMIVKRNPAAMAWTPPGKEFGLAFFGPKGGCKWELNLDKEEITTIWEQMGLEISRLRAVWTLAGMPERAERALQALQALNAYPFPEAIVDLITDLLHLARYKDFDPEAVVRLAVSNFEVEERR